MKHHITIEMLAMELGVSSEELLDKCRELGVPVLHGRIDKVLFMTVQEGSNS